MLVRKNSPYIWKRHNVSFTEVWKIKSEEAERCKMLLNETFHFLSIYSGCDKAREPKTSAKLICRSDTFHCDVIVFISLFYSILILHFSQQFVAVSICFSKCYINKLATDIQKNTGRFDRLIFLRFQHPSIIWYSEFGNVGDLLEISEPR